MFKHRLMLSVAATALLAMPAAARTTINSDRTKEVKTSTVNKGKPDNIAIGTSGSVTINAAGPAILIDSQNVVVMKGKVTNSGGDGAQGIVIDASGAPGGGYVVSGNILNVNGDIDLSAAKGTGKTGVLFSGGHFTGDIYLSPSSTMTVNGDNSAGLVIAAGTKLTGNLNSLGQITVTQSTAGSTTPTSMLGLSIGGKVTGDVNIGGQVNAAGQGAVGVVLTGTSAVGGTLNNTGSIYSTGILTPSSRDANPEAGGALVIASTVQGGFYNSGHLTSSDASTPVAQIILSGTGSAVQVGPGGGADLRLGAVPVAIDSTNTAGYGFVNHGSISAAPVDANQTASVVGLRFGGDATYNTIVTHGLWNTGSISVLSSSATGGVTPAAVSNSAGIIVGANALIPKLVNQSFGSGSGSIGASVSGTAGGSAVAVAILDEANPVVGGSSGTMEIDNLDGASIVASATTTETGIKSLAAVAISDESGTLTLINNTGTIRATATQLDNDAQIATAIDVSSNTSGVTINNGTVGAGVATKQTGTISGDILLGDGGDTINLTGFSKDVRSSITGNINFASIGTGAVNDRLNVGAFSDVTGALVSDDGNLDVAVAGTSTLAINNAALTTPVATLVHNLDIASGGSLDLTISEALAGGVIKANNNIALNTGAKFNVSFGSFLSNTGNFVLLDAPTGGLTIPDADQYHNDFTTPFLFTGGICTHNVGAFVGTATDCGSGVSTSSHSQLILALKQKTVADLGLTGFAAQMYPIANKVLPLDSDLGGAIVAGVTDKASAQQTYDAFAPTVNGGSRALAIAFTDQATGPIGARQRVLRTYGKQAGDSTLWGIEYAQFLKDPGQTLAGGGTLSGYKDHGFGFSLGADGGSAKNGWYGGALSFFTGDVGELGNRTGQSQSEWYMLSGYTDWRGRGLFLDSNLNVGVAQFKGKRILNLTIPLASGGTSDFSRTATSKHIGTYLSGGITTGFVMKYASTIITPQISLDALTMRENGYKESGGGGTSGDAFDLDVGSYNSNSFRAFTGVDLREDLNLGDFFLQPEGRIGYRYDFVNTPQKVTANFVALPGTANSFTIQGPDPSQGNIVAGGTIAASTDTWSIGVSYDWVRGSNGVTQQSGQLVLVGRI